MVDNMDFTYIFNVDDVESRHGYICAHYGRLKELDPSNELLKFATATNSEVYWNDHHSIEFFNKFNMPRYISNLRATLDLNYGMAIYDEIVRLTERESFITGTYFIDRLDLFDRVALSCKENVQPSKNIKKLLDIIEKN